jgi:hypothetical protein
MKWFRYIENVSLLAKFTAISLILFALIYKAVMKTLGGSKGLPSF